MTMFRRLHQDVVFSVSTVFLPPDVGNQSGIVALSEAGSRTPMTIIGLIDRSSAGPIAGAQQSVTAVAVPADLAGFIDCVPGEPVLRIDRLYFDRDGTPVELAVSHFNPARYSYRLELRR